MEVFVNHMSDKDLLSKMSNSIKTNHFMPTRMAKKSVDKGGEELEPLYTAI